MTAGGGPAGRPSTTPPPAAQSPGPCLDEVCVTCSDTAVAVTVLRLLASDLAIVDTGSGEEEVSVALVAVVGSTRTWGRLALTVSGGLAAVAVWLVPMAVTQPGGLSAWVHATRTEATASAHASCASSSSTP